MPIHMSPLHLTTQEVEEMDTDMEENSISAKCLSIKCVLTIGFDTNCFHFIFLILYDFFLMPNKLKHAWRGKHFQRLLNIFTFLILLLFPILLPISFSGYWDDWVCTWHGVKHCLLPPSVGFISSSYRACHCVLGEGETYTLRDIDCFYERKVSTEFVGDKDLWNFNNGLITYVLTGNYWLLYPFLSYPFIATPMTWLRIEPSFSNLQYNTFYPCVLQLTLFSMFLHNFFPLLLFSFHHFPFLFFLFNNIVSHRQWSLW